MLRNVLISLSRTNLQVTTVRNVQKKYPKVYKKFQAAAESLAARGFLRPNKPWDPPADIEETILKICSSNGLSSNAEFDALDTKFVVLKACFEETGHSVPNSLLHTIESVDDLKQFYKTPVDTRTPFDALKTMELPKNLHVQKQYVRFHPEVRLGKSKLLKLPPVQKPSTEKNRQETQQDKDTLFNGKSAFPKSSTIVSGLKTRKKYEGYSAKRSWP